MASILNSSILPCCSCNRTTIFPSSIIRLNSSTIFPSSIIRLNSSIRMAYKKEAPSIAIICATGAVGKELLNVIQKRDFPYRSMKMIASKQSAGDKRTFENKEYEVEELTEDSFDDVDIALFSIGATISKEFAPVAVDKGCIVIDNSSAFRMDENVPLIIPKINPEAMSNIRLSSPRRERIVASTYQAVSGAGAAAAKELDQQFREVMDGKPCTCNHLPKQLAYNVSPLASPICPNKYNEEEMKMVNETRKIWNDKNVKVSTTCIRVCTERGHAASVNLQFKTPMDQNTAIDILRKSAGVVVNDDTTPLEVSKKYEVEVGRVRQDISQEGNRGLELWICGDQLLKGAALNAIQLAERVLDAM